MSELGIDINGDHEKIFGSSDAGNVSFVFARRSNRRCRSLIAVSRFIPESLQLQ